LRNSLYTFAFLLMTWALPAHAGLLLEPYVGYEMGSAEVSSSGLTAKYDTSGITVGGRVGFTMPIFFAALDYSMANGKANLTSGPGTSPDLSRSSLFAVVGASLPLIRVYGGYGFLHELTMKDASGDGVFKGSALKLGASFTGLPFLALNLEYIMSSLNKYKASSGTESAIGTGNPVSDAKANAFMLSVSVPFDL
jgi:hypothetical protein